MKIEFAHTLSRELCRKHPRKIFLFGDNLCGYGNKGQACIRGEPNALGVPTKRAPSMNESAFFTDGSFAANAKAIDRALAKIPQNAEAVVIPVAGLGTGLAQLPQRAPQTYAYLTECLVKLGKRRTHVQD